MILECILGRLFRRQNLDWTGSGSLPLRRYRNNVRATPALLRRSQRQLWSEPFMNIALLECLDVPRALRILMYTPWKLLVAWLLNGILSAPPPRPGDLSLYEISAGQDSRVVLYYWTEISRVILFMDGILFWEQTTIMRGLRVNWHVQITRTTNTYLCMPDCSLNQSHLENAVALHLFWSLVPF